MFSYLVSEALLTVTGNGMENSLRKSLYDNWASGNSWVIGLGKDVSTQSHVAMMNFGLRIHMACTMLPLTSAGVEKMIKDIQFSYSELAYTLQLSSTHSWLPL